MSYCIIHSCLNISPALRRAEDPGLCSTSPWDTDKDSTSKFSGFCSCCSTEEASQQCFKHFWSRFLWFHISNQNDGKERVPQNSLHAKTQALVRKCIIYSQSSSSTIKNFPSNVSWYICLDSFVYLMEQLGLLKEHARSPEWGQVASHCTRTLCCEIVEAWRNQVGFSIRKALPG